MFTALLLSSLSMATPAYVMISIDAVPGVDTTLLLDGREIKPNRLVKIHPGVKKPVLTVRYKVGNKTYTRTSSLDIDSGDMVIIQIAGEFV